MNTSFPKPIFILFGFGVFAVLLGICFLLILPSKHPRQAFCNDAVDIYRCITDEATRTLDPSLCYVLDAGNQDRCVDEVVPLITDSNTCQKIPQWTIRARCLDQLQDKER